MRLDLVSIARTAMSDYGLIADFDAAVRNELTHLPQRSPIDGVKLDLRHLPWSSIDNRESRDLDQIECVEDLGNHRVRVRVGIADVDVLVHKLSAVDKHAFANTTSVYTGAVTFPMLPEILSTGLTSLNEDQDRLALVISFTVDAEGETSDPAVERAIVKNQARLSYVDVANWLDGNGPAPERVAHSSEQARQLKLQDEVAQRLRKLRHARGALELETIEARPVAKDGQIVDLELTKKNRARELIEDFMIAANTTMARFLEARGVPALRRVVKQPERWQRIAELASTHGVTLPAEPSARALAAFLATERTKDPIRFPDLSLSVVKLMGGGEYAVELPGKDHDGHFGLAVQDYTHSTAPNRRFADLVTQRLMKACERGEKAPYSIDELAQIAQRCTEKASEAQRVERRMRKVAAALFLADRVGQTFDGLVTGVNENGTFVRVLAPPAEGRVIHGERGMDVGDKVKVKLIATNPQKGFIDFARA